MIIKKITLRNFGPFLGEHSLDLNTLPEKPLILVGALNGGGKTSIKGADQDKGLLRKGVKVERVFSKEGAEVP